MRRAIHTTDPVEGTPTGGRRRDAARAVRGALALGALAAAASLLAPPEARAWAVLGGELDLTQRDFRVFNNFTHPSANRNQIPDPDFPGALGAELAIWKGVAEWGSRAHGSGTTDPTQDRIGSGESNFDAFYAGEATWEGGTNSNVISMIPGSNLVLAYTEIPIHDGWRIRFVELARDWNDNPNGPTEGARPYDIQGVAAHEYGHALGLDHSSVLGATMSMTSTNLGVDLRSIEDDDRAGLAHLYGAASPLKPRIDGYELTATGLRLRGVRFDPADNEVWFTPADPMLPGTGEPIRVSGVPSGNGGTTLDLAIPADAGPGDVVVKLPGSDYDDLSNAYPFDPFHEPWTPPRAYGPSTQTSFGTTPELSVRGLPSATAGFVRLGVLGGPTTGIGVAFGGTRARREPVPTGMLLVGGQVRREGAMFFLFGDGEASAAIGPADVGTTRYYQAWIPDPGSPGGGVLTNAVEVEIVP